VIQFNQLPCLGLRSSNIQLGFNFQGKLVVMAIIYLILIFGGGYLFKEWLKDWLRQRRSIQMRQHWLDNEEPQFRDYDGYPPDWRLRREEIMRRADFKCERCGTKVVWRRTRRSHGSAANIHHVVPISKGGQHDLGNLKCLCVNCHSFEHPGNRKLDPFFRRRQYNQQRRKYRY